MPDEEESKPAPDPTPAPIVKTNTESTWETLGAQKPKEGGKKEG